MTDPRYPTLRFTRFRGEGGFMPWFEDRVRELAMKTRDCRLDEIPPGPDDEPVWMMDGESIRRPDGRFFTVGGRHTVGMVEGREVTGWGQPIIFGDGGGTIGVVTNVTTQDVLVRVQGEIGAVGYKLDGVNPTHVVVSPSLQFSLSNLEHHEKWRRGEDDDKGQPCRPVALAELVNPNREDLTIHLETAHEDGGRFGDKVNNYARVMVQAPEELEGDFKDLPAGRIAHYTWVSLPVLREIRRAGHMTAQLRSAMAMLA